MKTKKSSTTKLYIAVIVGAGRSTDITLSLSNRERGDWASFVGTSLPEVVKAARQAQVAWEESGEFGPYRILTGVIDSVVEFPVKFQLVPLKVKE